MAAADTTRYADLLEHKLMMDAAYNTPEWAEFMDLAVKREEAVLRAAKHRMDSEDPDNDDILKELEAEVDDLRILADAAYKRSGRECRRLQAMIHSVIGPLREKARKQAREESECPT